jgi:glycine cleavage system regulatory protein
MEGYAAWVASFLDTVGVREPVLVVGHSFGGGVATRFAFDAPDRVRSLVLINSVGGAGWAAGPDGAVRPADRPFWEASWELAREMFWSDGGYRIIEAVQEDLIGNLMRNPRGMAEIGLLASRADLTAELAEMRRRELPILVLSSDRDILVPTASFNALCAAIGADGQVLEGGHSWLLANPRAFGAVVDNLLQVQAHEDEVKGVRGTVEELRRLLETTTMPRARVKRLLAGADPLWLMSDSSAVLGRDLALCHPALGAGEVRAAVRPMAVRGTHRLTVVAADRPGLLADTAAALAAEGLSVLGASASTWEETSTRDQYGLALHSMTVSAPDGWQPETWDALGDRLRSMDSAPRGKRARYVPTGQAKVTVSGEGSGQTLVKVTAPDGLGLLEAVCRWFADHDVSIAAARITTRGDTAIDTFLVDGTFDPSVLAHHLSRPRRSMFPHLPGCRWLSQWSPCRCR